MRKLFYAGASLLLLAACSQDEMLQVNHDGDEIRFNAVANSAARAADVYCNSNRPSAFSVWAEYDSKTYITGDKIVYNSTGSKWENQSGIRYWPETDEAKLNFYAYVNTADASNSLFKWNSASPTTAPTIEGFSVNDAVASQVDLLYAVKKDVTKPADASSNNPVTLNFRHALSQIVFQAKNTNANLYVEIYGVKVGNVNNTGKFAYPSTSTDGNIEHIDTPSDGKYDETSDFSSQTIGTQGTWSALSGKATYAVTFNKVALSTKDQIEALTTKLTDNQHDAGTGNGFGNAMLLMPQTTTAWVPADNQASMEGTTGSYIGVTCKIFNVSDANKGYQEGTDVCLWGEGETSGKELVIPAAFTWEQGKKYVYTLKFGEGNGGYEPGTDDPVLIPITFTVKVDEFVPVNGGEIESTVTEEGEGA